MNAILPLFNQHMSQSVIEPPQPAQVPAPPAATWTAPAWATESTFGDGAWHKASQPVALLDDTGRERQFAVRLVQHDTLTVGPDGVIVIDRSEPEVFVKTLRFNVEQAAQLAEALAVLVSSVQAQGRP